jgi:hypothetical protein
MTQVLAKAVLNIEPLCQAVSACTHRRVRQLSSSLVDYDPDVSRDQLFRPASAQPRSRCRAAVLISALFAKSVSSLSP